VTLERRQGAGGRRGPGRGPVVEEVQPVAGEQLVGLRDVDGAAEEVRDLAVAMPRIVGLEAAGEVFEQARRSRGDLVVDRLLAGLEGPGQPRSSRRRRQGPRRPRRPYAVWPSNRAVSAS